MPYIRLSVHCHEPYGIANICLLFTYKKKKRQFHMVQPDSCCHCDSRPRKLDRIKHVGGWEQRDRSEIKDGSVWHSQPGHERMMDKFWRLLSRPQRILSGFLAERPGPTDKPGVVYQSRHKKNYRLSCPSPTTQRSKQTRTSLPALPEPLSVNRNQITCCLESDMWPDSVHCARFHQWWK